MPVVPRIDIPPTMPRREFDVLAAMSAPPGTDTDERDRAVGHLMDGRPDHAGGYPVDGRCPDRETQAGQSDGADTRAGRQLDGPGGTVGRQPRRRHGDVGAVGHVRIVTGVLDHGGSTRAGRVDVGDRETHPLPRRAEPPLPPSAGSRWPGP